MENGNTAAAPDGSVFPFCVVRLKRDEINLLLDFGGFGFKLYALTHIYLTKPVISKYIFQWFALCK